MTRHSPSRIFAYLAKLRYFFVIAAIFGMLSTIAGPAFAAGGLSGSAAGKILDATTGAPVPGATITISSPQGTIKQDTAKDGTFQFLSVPIDTYTISVDAPGYTAFVQPGIGITGGSTNDLGTLRLQKVTTKVIATTHINAGASSAFVRNQTVPQTTISGATLVSAQGKAGSVNEVSALLAAPGFQQDKMGNLIIEGSLTDQVHYNFDGVDFTDPGFSGSDNGQFFNGISSVQVIPGAGDPSQGNSGSGVVNLVVKRGTYPGTGLADIEYDLHQNSHQIGFSYGTATRNNSVSDFVSFFKTDSDVHYGGYGYTPLDTNTSFDANQTHATDFVNNFVVKFGRNQNQSLQVLNLFHTSYGVTSENGTPDAFDNVDPGELGEISFFGSHDFGTGAAYPSLSPSELSSITQRDPFQPAQGNYVSNVTSPSNSSLFKLEYDNTFNPTTFLNLRYFHSDVNTYDADAASQIGLPQPAPLSGQSTGGSRTGTNFELFKQADSRNLLTLSGSYEFNRPSFGSGDPVQGIETLGPNAALFLRPANANAPVSASNPCPADAVASFGAAACFLQQYFYTQGGTPRVPDLDLDSKNVQQIFGVGLRDQVQVNDRLRLDVGARYDHLDNGYGNDLTYEDEGTQPVPGVPGQYYVHNYPFVEQPHFLEPRYGASYQITRNDTVGLEYGRSINQEGAGELASPENYQDFQAFTNIPITPALVAAYTQFNTFNGNPPVINTGTDLLCKTGLPYSIGAGASAKPNYNGVVGTTLQLGRSCANLGDLLYQQEDLYYPEIAAVQPAVIDNLDFNYAHQFKNGMAVKLAPYFRNEYRVQSISAPLVFNPITNNFSVGSLQSTSSGRNTTTGLNFDFTLPDRPTGFTGFLNMSYVNEFTNTPAAGDNAFGQDFEPIISPTFALVQPMFRAGFVSPFTTNLGLAYKTKTGFRINPVLHFNAGFPYNAGSSTADIINGKGVIVANTNETDFYNAYTGGAPLYVDPANPGSELAPNIAASRGQKETPNGGGLLSRPQVTADMTFEFTPPHSRSTIGLQILDVFDNEYLGAPSPNGFYYPVTSGVAGPLTGQNPSVTPGLVDQVAKGTYPYASYVIPTSNTLPTTLRLYYQLAL